MMNRALAATTADTIEKNIETINTLWHGYAAFALTPQARTLANRFTKNREAYINQALHPAVLALRANDYRQTRALASVAQVLYDQTSPDLHDLNQLAVNDARDAYLEGIRRFEHARLWALSALAVAMLIMSWLGWVLAQTGINPQRLKLELTESLVLHNVADTIDKMKALNQQGIHFSMDDFGTGYSSLAYLTRLPIAQLKIDRSFVSNIDCDHNDAMIVQTIIGMAHNLGLAVIAEGVETEAQRACLEHFGCPTYQGYLYGKPMPLREFETLARQAIMV